MKTKDLTVLLQEAVTSRYGNNIPSQILYRLGEEWDFLRSRNIEKDFIRAYNITNKLCQHKIPWIISGVDGGSSLIAFLLEITQVNPLPTHYYCPQCKKVKFVIDVKDGFDLPDLTCDHCGHIMHGDGHNISFSWFANNVHPLSKYISMGEYRVSVLTDAVIDEVASSCDLPIFYDEVKFVDYARILMLSFNGLRQLQWLCQKTCLTERDIPVNDTDALDCLFESIGKDYITESDLACTIGLIPCDKEDEFSVKPQIWYKSRKNDFAFSDLVQFQGLYHMEKDDKYELPSELWDTFYDRDSLAEYFCKHDIPPETAFNLSDDIRKGKGYMSNIKAQLKSFSVDSIVINAARHIRYLLSRSYAISFGMLYARLAWFSLHYPDEYQQSVDMIKTEEKWSQVLELLEPELTEISFNTWVKPIKVNSVDKKLNVIHLAIDNYMAVDLIKDKYRSIFENAVKEVYGRDFEFTIEFCEK